MGKRVTRLCLMLAVILGSSAVRGGDLCVPGQYPSIQSAIDDAEDGDVVIVDPNTYYENINFLGKAIAVRSTDPNNPNIVSATIIDGSLPADPNYASVVTFNSSEGNDSVLEGFTITGGTGTWLVIAWDLHEPYWNRCGGGVVCYNMSEPTITKNIFSNNRAGEGGGIYIYGNPVDMYNPSDPPIHLEPVISKNKFINNWAEFEHGFEPPNDDYTFAEHGDGGAIVTFQGVDAIVTQNLMENNHAFWLGGYGGGIHMRQWSNGVIEDNQIIGNDAALGGGIHITYSSSPAIRNNLIQANITNGLGGGGIYIYYLSCPVVEHNLITQNESGNGAGITIILYCEPVINNNIIANNTLGAGIRLKNYSAAIISNNTIIGNSGVPLWAGGIDSINADPIIQNNIIASNGYYGIYSSTNAPVITYNDVWDHLSGNYSSVLGDLTGMNGNISADPNFVGTENYHLLPGSPCVNAGNPNTNLPPDSVDIDGEERIFENLIDIGADEVVTNKADFNTDGIVGWLDLVMLIDEWLSSDDDLQSDLSNDSFIDFADYAAFAEQWLWEAGWYE